MALLPKGKPNANSPLDWRPIGLQHPLGKAIMKTVMTGAKERIAAASDGIPARTEYHDGTQNCLCATTSDPAAPVRDSPYTTSMMDRFLLSSMGAFR